MESEVPEKFNNKLPMSHFLIHSLILHALCLFLLFRFAPSPYGSNNGMLRIIFTDQYPVISLKESEERLDYRKAEKAPAPPVMTPQRAASPKKKAGKQAKQKSSAAIKHESTGTPVRQADTPYLLIPPVKEEEKKVVFSKPPGRLPPNDQPQDKLQLPQETDRQPVEKAPVHRKEDVAKPDRVALVADKPLPAAEGKKPVQEEKKSEEARQLPKKIVSSSVTPVTIDNRPSDIGQRDVAPAVPVTNEQTSETQSKRIEKEELLEQPQNKDSREEKAGEGAQVEIYRDGKNTVEVFHEEKAPPAQSVAVSPAKEQKAALSKPLPVHARQEKKDDVSYKENIAMVITEGKPPQQPEPVSVKEQEKAEAERPGNILFVEPEVFGDIKLEIMSQDVSLQSLQVKVLFKEYPKNRRNGSVFRHKIKSRPIKPKNVRNLANMVSIVVDNTSEGIYDLIVDYPGRPLSARVTLKLHEKKVNALSRDLGIRTIGQNGLLIRVRMPEGILWDDDAYFSGSIEDSESVTKFNNETGVVWKELKE